MLHFLVTRKSASGSKWKCFFQPFPDLDLCPLNMAGDIIDDKSEHCIPFLLERLKIHREKHDTPFVLGLNGVQGAGKTTLVRSTIDYFAILHASITCPMSLLESANQTLLLSLSFPITCLSSAFPHSANLLDTRNVSDDTRMISRTHHYPH
jgi:hypothetical protein